MERHDRKSGLGVEDPEPLEGGYVGKSDTNVYVEDRGTVFLPKFTRVKGDRSETLDKGPDPRSNPVVLYRPHKIQCPSTSQEGEGSTSTRRYGIRARMSAKSIHCGTIYIGDSRLSK